MVRRPLSPFTSRDTFGKVLPSATILNHRNIESYNSGSIRRDPSQFSTFKIRSDNFKNVNDKADDRGIPGEATLSINALTSSRNDRGPIKKSHLSVVAQRKWGKAAFTTSHSHAHATESSISSPGDAAVTWSVYNTETRAFVSEIIWGARARLSPHCSHVASEHREGPSFRK